MLELELTHAIDALTLRLSLRAGTGITALFGRSGCGKTTALNLIAGLLTPRSGRIVLNSRVLFDSTAHIHVPAHQRRIGYVFQDARLFAHLSVQQNLRYGQLFNRHAPSHILFDDVVALLDLAGLLRRRPHHLSGGEAQRVAIGRALLAQPELLLMDEPLSALDAHRRGEILYYIERLRDEIRLPIIYVSHAIEEVVRLADQMVLLSDGEIAASGPVREVMSRIELRRMVGRYEGGAVIEATVRTQDLASGLAHLAFDGGVLRVPDVDALVGASVRVRIRARDVSIALSAPAGISMLNCLPGRITEISDESGSSVDVRIEVGQTAVIARVTRYSVAQLDLHVGQSVFALIKAVSLDRHSTGFA